ncbi:MULTISPECIES: 3' terminal RNA ribose 2'-O-methyltransferase Hen1 [unclassified Dietzia]|uniref:3' terminal RNA ribose 2'-O-methyltransferase Hen1 n=1 Tax=unclassified Dietzia TaxID=2617939 RepID=UPI0015F9F70B|nr:MULTISPECIES: 3' terminal RNA ribose 2'-O-methyltransferase Hen1 [unclassified Dietzia]MBB1023162.1 3' terminal RNA ribose 2'-O-methyltransferase Hen1 [Dietzia sp. DQ12-76]MBB1026553.1 3' terminal RNA ribose 2'-O-methyltransferase Hen1 [Dietzia sp. DQ11-38-2]
MLLTITARRSEALPTPGDLGFLLHKHPDKVQSFGVYAGTAHVFYPEVSTESCTAAVLLEVEAVALVRGRSGRADAFALGHYVNDRPYVASSLLAVAMGKVFRSALNGQCVGYEDLVEAPLDLTISLPTVPGEPDLVRRLFAPLGWDIQAESIAFDATRPQWGAAPLVGLTLTGSVRLTDALSHLYVLLPVLDAAKHYWVGQDEVDKLLRAGDRWLPGHPERDLVTHRYLAGQRDLRESALARLAELDDRAAESTPDAAASDAAAAPRPLVSLRHDAVLEVVRDLAPVSIADMGCGSGALLGGLLKVRGVARVIGTEVSDFALSKAATRLHVDSMTERQADRLSLLRSSLMYEDERLADLDMAILMEVIEHVDPDRLPAVVRNVFGAMHPRHVVITTPNVEYNVHYPALATGGFRHPDHRFEWTREQFQSWAHTVAGAHGYQVEFRPVGEPDGQVGPPTQMAVFSQSAPVEVSA